MDKRIALFGGTFNPIHSGHVEMASKVLELPQIEKLIIMPTYQPPHKDAPELVSGEHRLNMCRIALCGLDNVEFSALELERKGKSYTYNTVCELNSVFDKRIALVCGGDMITTFNGWYRYRDILTLADIIAFRRVGVDNTEFDNAVESLRTEGGNISVIDLKISNISSSEVRNGRMDMVPDEVLEYIKNNGLYGVK